MGAGMGRQPRAAAAAWPRLGAEGTGGDRRGQRRGRDGAGDELGLSKGRDGAEEGTGCPLPGQPPPAAPEKQRVGLSRLTADPGLKIN